LFGGFCSTFPKSGLIVWAGFSALAKLRPEVFNISFLQHKINETVYGLISLLREKYLIYKFAKTPASASQERISLCLVDFAPLFPKVD
jgi:hypothetical protein